MFGWWIVKLHRSTTMAPDAEEEEPCAIVVMGVSGAGKSTIAAMLAVRLGWAYEEKTICAYCEISPVSESF